MLKETVPEVKPSGVKKDGGVVDEGLDLDAVVGAQVAELVEDGLGVGDEADEDGVGLGCEDVGGDAATIWPTLRVVGPSSSCWGQSAWRASWAASMRRWRAESPRSG